MVLDYIQEQGLEALLTDVEQRTADAFRQSWVDLLASERDERREAGVYVVAKGMVPPAEDPLDTDSILRLILGLGTATQYTFADDSSIVVYAPKSWTTFTLLDFEGSSSFDSKVTRVRSVAYVTDAPVVSEDAPSQVADGPLGEARLQAVVWELRTQGVQGYERVSNGGKQMVAFHTETLHQSGYLGQSLFSCTFGSDYILQEYIKGEPALRESRSWLPSSSGLHSVPNMSPALLRVSVEYGESDTSPEEKYITRFDPTSRRDHDLILLENPLDPFSDFSRPSSLKQKPRVTYEPFSQFPSKSFVPPYTSGPEIEDLHRDLLRREENIYPDSSKGGFKFSKEILPLKKIDKSE